MASQKQIEANRINARKSTGPRSAEGKAVSKLNRLSHGLRAEENVLPGEDPDEFRTFVDAWADDWKPPSMARLELVEEAATAAWRRRRCRRVETARIARRVRIARNRLHRDEAARLDAAMVHLQEDPRPALDALMRSRDGVDRLIAMWSEIERASRSIDTWDDHEAHHYTMIALQGFCPADPPMVPLRDASWGLYLRNRPEDRDEGDVPIGDGEAAEAAAWIHRRATEHLAWLSRVRAGLPDAMREAEAQAFEPRPEDAALLRYEAHLSRQFHRSLGNLIKLTKSGDDLVEPEADAPDEPDSPADEAPDDVAPNEPNLPTESDAREGVAADPESAESPSEERRDAAESPVAPPCPPSTARKSSPSTRTPPSWPDESPVH